MLLGAFGLNLLGKVRRTDTSYILANAVGASLAAIAAWLIDYMPFVILEGIWCFVSISTLAAVHIRTQPN